MQPYVGNWWPPGHGIGYEHTFIHAVADFVNACVEGKPVQPTFEDGLKNQRVLDGGRGILAKGQVGEGVNVALGLGPNFSGHSLDATHDSGLVVGVPHLRGPEGTGEQAARKRHNETPNHRTSLLRPFLPQALDFG